MLAAFSSAGALAAEILRAERECSNRLARLEFPHPPVHTVYDPLRYAWEAHEAYVRRAVAACDRQQPWRPIMLLGMNPGPYGMAQNGVPFGEAAAVRTFIGLDPARITIAQPQVVHPRRPILGFDCTRSEVSGKRLWGWAEDRYGEKFFDHFFVANYCPLVFMASSGANVVPSRLGKGDLEIVESYCDHSLEDVISALSPRVIIGVGEFAHKRALRVVSGMRTGEECDGGDDISRREVPPVEKLLHPSPASPAANRGWARAADAAVTDILLRHGSLLADVPRPGRGCGESI